MSAPYVVEQKIGSVDWFLVSGLFPTAFMAKQAWEAIERREPNGTLGVYRHGIEGESDGRVVSCVSLQLDEIRRAMHRLRLGEHYEMPEHERKALIMRRAHVVSGALATGQPYGRLKWRRPEDRPARLDHSTGEMIEREPPQG